MKCRTCRDETVAEDVRTYLGLRAAGTATKGIEHLLEWLRRERSYQGSYSGLLRHMKECEAELYAQRQPLKRC